jgi:hypothetical protein
VRVSDKALLAMDTEVAAGWWWYDGKTTHRLQVFVGQWIDSPIQLPFGWVILPDIIMGNRSMRKRYVGLPVVTRLEALRLIHATITDADTLVGHNLSGFDIGTINGELMIKNLPMLPKRTVIDTLTDGPKGVFQKRSLGDRLSRLDGTVEKPSVDPVVWEAAFNEYDPDALREVWSRAVTDVQGHIDLFINDLEVSYV